MKEIGARIEIIPRTERERRATIGTRTTRTIIGERAVGSESLANIGATISFTTKRFTFQARTA